MQTIRKTLEDLPRSPGPKTSSSPGASTTCAVCGGWGHRPARPDEPEYREGYVMNVDCEACLPERRARQREEMQSASCMTGEEKSLRLDHIAARAGSGTGRMVAACREMLDGRASLLTFWGGHGNAKTAVMIATVNEFLDRGRSALYTPAWDLLNWIQQAFNSGAEVRDDSAYERLDQFRRVPMLAVDELQAIRITDWRLEQIRNLLDWRYRRGLDGQCWTLLAMNENPAALEPRIYSRLGDGRNRLEGHPILHNTDPDMRPLMKA